MVTQCYAHFVCGSLHAYVTGCVCVSVCVFIFACYAEADVPDRHHPVDHIHSQDGAQSWRAARRWQ